MNYVPVSFSTVWLSMICEIIADGALVSPRGKLTREIPQNTIKVNMRTPVLDVPDRKLSYQFMAAEAHWILSGSDRVEDIAPWNKRIADFSDNGETFFGAYGPKLMDQIRYVVSKLDQDKDTRQAGMTFWRENPPETKDVPCTIAMFFNIRDGHLNNHTFMRSSDAWLGIPYDVFNFSMIAHLICGLLNIGIDDATKQIKPGTLYLTAASSHLYEEHWKSAIYCVQDNAGEVFNQVQTAIDLWTNPQYLIPLLGELRYTKPGNILRWWEEKV